MSSLQKFVRNQPFDPRAADLNAMVDSARAHRAGRNKQRIDKSQLFRQATIIKLRNDTGADRAAFDIVAAGSVPVTPTANLAEFKLNRAMVAVAPGTPIEWGKLAVYIEPVKANAYGRAVVSGVVPVQITVNSTGHLWADMTDGVYDKLTSRNSGSARILYQEAGTGDKWAVVRLSNPRPAQYLGRVVDASVPGRAATPATDTISLCTVLVQQTLGTILLPALSSRIVTAWNISGFPLHQNQWVYLQIEDETGDVFVTGLPGGPNNKGIVLRTALPVNPLVNGSTIAFTSDFNYVTDTSLPVYLDGAGGLAVNPVWAEAYAGVRFWFTAMIETATPARHATLWAYDVIQLQVGQVDASWHTLVPPAGITIPAHGPLTDSGGDTITIPSRVVALAAKSGDGLGSCSGMGWSTGAGPFTLNVLVTNPSGSTYKLTQFLLFAEAFGVADGYGHL